MIGNNLNVHKVLVQLMEIKDLGRHKTFFCFIRNCKSNEHLLLKNQAIQQYNGREVNPLPHTSETPGEYDY